MPKLSDLDDASKMEEALQEVEAAYKSAKEDWENTCMNGGVQSEGDLKSMVQRALDHKLDCKKLIENAKHY